MLPQSEPHRPHILLVDPDAARAAVGATALSHRGYDVLTAHDADRGTALLSTGTFDVVLADLDTARGSYTPGTPDSPGGAPSLLTEARRYPPQTIAMILTGPAKRVTLMDALREGAYDFLTAPYTVELLCAVVARAVERVTLARTMRELLEDLETANAQLRAFSRELQRRVDDATAQLRRRVDDLAAANRALEEAHRQREEFISFIVHELGGPLTAVAGYAQFLGCFGSSGTAESSAETAAMLEARERARKTIISETRRMARLVNDLADGAQAA